MDAARAMPKGAPPGVRHEPCPSHEQHGWGFISTASVAFRPAAASMRLP